MSGFRLLSATVVDNRGREREISLAAGDPGSGDESWTSVVIGRNGLGKSRLLAGIAHCLESPARAGGRRDLASTVARLEYTADGHQIVLEPGRSARLDGLWIDPKYVPLPRRIIALATTPFDKFRLALPGYARPASQDAQRYAYLGLRDSRGRASATAAVFRALDGLFGAASADERRRARVAEVFEFLGYEPRVEVRYRWTRAGEELLRIPDASTLARALSEASERPYSPLGRLLRFPALDPEQLLSIARAAAERTDQREVVLTAYFRSLMSEDDQLFRDIQLLRRAELVGISEVALVQRGSGERIDLRGVSSGEFALVTALLGLASAMDDDSLILIDEPEVSLHPEWQSQYLSLLDETFAKFMGCHFVVATHSPQILSAISSSRSTVVSLDPGRGTAEPSMQFAGRSPDVLLMEAFNVVDEDNLYLKQLVVEALRLAADGELETDRYGQLLSQLAVFSRALDPQSGPRMLIEELQTATSQFRGAS